MLLDVRPLHHVMRTDRLVGDPTRPDLHLIGPSCAVFNVTAHLHTYIGLGHSLAQPSASKHRHLGRNQHLTISGSRRIFTFSHRLKQTKLDRKPSRLTKLEASHHNPMHSLAVSTVHSLAVSTVHSLGLFNDSQSRMMILSFNTCEIHAEILCFFPRLNETKKNLFLSSLENALERVC
jgi:hypothetical protein